MATEQELQSFNTLDHDQDGKVSIDELFFKSWLKCSHLSRQIPVAPQELLARYDSDKDGSITFEELKAAVEKADNLT